MRYICLVHFEPSLLDNLPPKERKDIDRRSLGYNDELTAGGHLVLAQAILLRHAVFPTMVVIRELFLRPFSAAAAASALGHALLFFVIIGVHWLGVIIAIALFGVWCGRLAVDPQFDAKLV